MEKSNIRNNFPFFTFHNGLKKRLFSKGEYNALIGDNLMSILPGEPETFSLFGKPLYRSPIQPGIENIQQSKYEEALKKYKSNPDDPDNIIRLGRRTA